MSEDDAAIRKLYRESASALRSGDVSALVELYTMDAIQMPPDRPALSGREAIESALRRELDGIALTASIEVIESKVAGGWAFARGTYRMVVREPDGDGDIPEVTAGNWLDILERQPEGSWKIARATWTTTRSQGSGAGVSRP